jgi:hypothetical protein
MSKYSVTRPIEDPREFAIAHAPSLAETAPRQKPAHFLGLYEFLLRADFSKRSIVGRFVECFNVGRVCGLFIMKSFVVETEGLRLVEWPVPIPGALMVDVLVHSRRPNALFAHGLGCQSG